MIADQVEELVGYGYGAFKSNGHLRDHLAGTYDAFREGRGS